MTDDDLALPPGQRTAWCRHCNGPTTNDELGCMQCRGDASKKALQLRAMRAKRRRDRRCTDCNAGLQETDKSRCVECVEKARLSSIRYRRKHPDRRRETQQRLRLRRPLSFWAAKAREFRAARKLTDRCIECVLPALPDNHRCEFHREKHRAMKRNYWRRKHGSRAMRKIVDAAAYRKQPQNRIATATRNQGFREILAYVPHEERAAAPRVVLLKAMRWLDWANSKEIFDVAGIQEWKRDDDKERNTMQRAFTTFVRAGLIERRGHKCAYDYRLTEAGRIEADKIRNGQVKIRKFATRRAA